MAPSKRVSPTKKKRKENLIATEKTNGESVPVKEDLPEKESSNEDTDKEAADHHTKKEIEDNSENEAEETKDEEDGDDASINKNNAADEDGVTIDEVVSDSLSPSSEEADTKTKPEIGDNSDESEESEADENKDPEKSSEKQKPRKEPKKMKASDKAKNDSKCYKCGEVGHYSRECLIEGADKCFNCKEEGHKSKQCKKPKPCHNCQKPGHQYKGCPEPKKPKELKRTAKDGDDKEATAPKRKKNLKEEKRKCFTCGETGHSYADCKKEKVCHNCKEVGHKKKDCPQPKKMTKEIKKKRNDGGCFKCGQEGHMAYQCKSAKTEEMSMG